MCGIAGFIDTRKGSGLEELRRMTDALVHRGPDGEGQHVVDHDGAQVGLGHRRLSIIDLSCAAGQPMHWGELSLVFNGEIYNHAEIRKELEASGHQFSTHSDTEVILHAWQQWGTAAIQKWHGMFAIVIYDRRAGTLTLIRDRAGVKPLYYYQHDGLFLFGSELKALMAHPQFRKDINPDAVRAFLQYGHVPAPHCIFRHAHKLFAGHLLRLDLKTQEAKIEKYWDVYDAYNQPKLDIPLPEAIDEAERILEKAFQLRMVADVPVGVFLSGGYDSSCVTALLQKNRTEPLKTFTIGVENGGLDEAPFAKEIAKRLGTAHTEYYCTIQEALDIIPTLPHFYDEPFADSSAIPTMLVSRMARKDVTVALSADAGDEIFAGYNRYDYISRYGQKMAAIPAPLRRLMVGAMNTISSEAIPVLRNKPNFHNRYDKVKNLLADPSTKTLLKNLSQVFSDKEVSALMARPSHTLDTAYESDALANAEADPLAYMMAVDYQTYMADDILQKVDRATMSASLEGREPFLDQNIIEWAARLPSDYKYHNGVKKYILREIVHRHLPKELMERPKMGFAIPVKDWLKHELRELVQEHLSPQALAAHGLLNAAAVGKLLSQFYAGRSEHYVKVWYLLQFQMWYRRWMQGGA